MANEAGAEFQPDLNNSAAQATYGADPMATKGQNHTIGVEPTRSEINKSFVMQLLESKQRMLGVSPYANRAKIASTLGAILDQMRRNRRNKKDDDAKERKMQITLDKILKESVTIRGLKQKEIDDWKNEKKEFMEELRAIRGLKEKEINDWKNEKKEFMEELRAIRGLKEKEINDWKNGKEEIMEMLRAIRGLKEKPADEEKTKGVKTPGV